MPRKVKEKSALEVGRMVEPGLHAVGGVPGLHLRVASPENRSWVLRTMVGGKRRDLGLGGFPGTGLADARAKARAARASITTGVDPSAARRKARQDLIAARIGAVTFDEATTRFLAAKGSEWRNSKHRAQWAATLASYVSPLIGKMPVADIGVAHVLAVLQQREKDKPDGPDLWNRATETASRVRGRIENVLDWATARGYRTGENPARWRGHLDKLLARPTKIAKVKHHRALAVEDVGAFMAELRKNEGIPARALEFAILTAARSGEVRGAAWGEVDLDAKVWTVPATRMKAGREHRVPLSDAAVRVLRTLPRIESEPLVFPGAVADKKTGTLRPISDMTFTMVVRRIGADCVPHGFRSTFRDWCAERTNYPREIAEAALAHVLKDKTEAAYQRSDLLDKRAHMMQAWADFLSCAESKDSKVVPIRAA